MYVYLRMNDNVYIYTHMYRNIHMYIYIGDMIYVKRDSQVQCMDTCKRAGAHYIRSGPKQTERRSLLQVKASRTPVPTPLPRAKLRTSKPTVHAVLKFGA